MYIDKKELCKKLNVSPSTIHRYIKKGLPHYRVGEKLIRFKFDEVEKWLKDKQKGE